MPIEHDNLTTDRPQGPDKVGIPPRFSSGRSAAQSPDRPALSMSGGSRQLGKLAKPLLVLANSRAEPSARYSGNRTPRNRRYGSTLRLPKTPSMHVRGMSVLVEDAAEALVSSHVQTGDLVRIGDRRGQ
jgi:hypothetical protein